MANIENGFSCKNCGAPATSEICPYCGSPNTFLVTGNQFEIKEREAETEE